nr:reverse transcriptase domain-containing protein [Tanacetum cinerariifolium]
MACEEYSQKVLGFSDVTASGNSTPYDDPIVSTTSPTLTPFADSDFLLFEEADAFLGLEDDPDSLKINPFYYDPKGDILLLEAILNRLTSLSRICVMESDNKLPVIIAKELGDEEKSALIKRTTNQRCNIRDELIPRSMTSLRKRRRQCSPVPTECLPIDACLLASAMHRARFKGDSKARLLCWVLLLQVFDFKVPDKKRAENLAADHLSRLENPYENVLDPKGINETFSLRTLSMVTLRGDSIAVGVFHFPADFVVVDFEPDLRVLLILRRCFLKTSRALIDVHKGELTLQQNLPSFKEELKAYKAQTIKSSIDEPPEVELKDLPHHLEYAFLEGNNKLPVIIAKELRSEEKAVLIKVLKSHKRAIAWILSDIQDTTVSGNPTPIDDPNVSTTSPTLTPFRDSDFLLFEEADAFLAKTIKSSVDEPPEVELKDLPHHLEYAFLEGDNKLPVIIAKELGSEEKAALIKVLKSHKQAIAWKLSDIQGINPEFCTHKFLMEEDYKLAANYNDMTANRIDVIDMACEEYSQEVLGFSDVIASGNPTPYYDPIVSNSSPTLTPFGDSDFLLEKVNAFLALENDPTSPEVDHSYYDTDGDILLLEAFLNDDPSLPRPTQGVPFPTSFHGSNARKISEKRVLLFSRWFSGYFQIPIDPKDQEKTTFNCPYGTFSYRRMSFGLCNAPSTFQRCMVAIFHDMIEKMMEVFMEDFSVFENSFGTCLSHLDKMLQRCEDTNLCLNWEKSHFMVKEGIVLGHKITKNGIEVDKAKVDVIAKLPHPTTVKGIRSFLGRASFYRRFIKDFSKISRPITHLLEKNTLFIFFDECIQAFETLKKKPTEASILIAPD